MRIEGDTRRIGYVVASADLPQSSQSRARLQVEDCRVLIKLEFVFHDGTWTDNTHFAADDVDKLWKLIQAQFTQNTADGSDTRIVLQFAGRLPLLVCLGILLQMVLQYPVGVRRHRPELEAMEEAAVMADATVSIKDLAAIGKLHQRHEKQKERAEEDERQ